MAVGLGGHLVRRHRDVTSGAAAGPRRRADRRGVGEVGVAEADAAGRAEAEVAAGVVGLRRTADVGERLERQVGGRWVAAHRAVLPPATGVAPAEADDDDDDHGDDEEDGQDEAGQNDQTTRVGQQRRRQIQHTCTAQLNTAVFNARCNMSTNVYTHYSQMIHFC